MNKSILDIVLTTNVGTTIIIFLFFFTFLLGIFFKFWFFPTKKDVEVKFNNFKTTMDIRTQYLQTTVEEIKQDMKELIKCLKQK